jgi:DNA-binding CsgD family transcriptional regulator
MGGSARAATDLGATNSKLAEEIRRGSHSWQEWNETGTRPNEIWSVTTPVPRLTRRETEVLTWLAMGKSASETGVILEISVCTVRLHVQNIKRKLVASNIAHAVAQAHRAGILGLDRSEDGRIVKRPKSTSVAKNKKS